MNIFASHKRNGLNYHSSYYFLFYYEVMANTQIIFLILPHLHLLDLAGADQVFLEAIGYGAKIQVHYCSFTTSLHTSTTLPFGDLQHFSAISPQVGDFIFIPGADINYMHSKELAAEKQLLEWVTMAYQRGAKLCTICTGAFFLGLAGLLNGRRCTTHWKRTAELQRHYPKAKVQENILFTEEDGIYTSAGVTSGIDLALHILTQMKDDYFAFKVARELVVYNRRTGETQQQSVFLTYRNHIHTGIHLLQDWLQLNLHRPSTLLDLAEIASMSTRNLTRIFKQETGITLHDYITLLRKEKIAELLKNPNLSRKQIAEQCGLSSERQISRLLAG